VRKGVNIMLILVALLSLFFGFQDRDGPSPWLILYSKNATKEQLNPYNPLVFDAHNHPSLQALDRNKEIYAHINVGSLLISSHEFAARQSQTMNAEGQDAFLTRWVDGMSERAILPLIRLGFNGIYFDGFNEFKMALGQMNFKPKETLFQIFLLLRQRFPNLLFLIEADPDVAEDIGNTVQGVIKFSALTRFNETTGKYDFLEDSSRQAVVAQLSGIKEQFSNIQIFTVDYWNPKDKQTIKKIYEIEQKSGFRPYVADMELNLIVPRT
jgi:hypothetical protein